MTNPVHYMVISERIENPPSPKRITYGILARSSNYWAAIRDISSYRFRVELLARLLNRFQVSIYHFRDVVEDFLEA
jgi:hypothetical protein